MSMNVVKPGALSLFQDNGRFGFQKLGVPVCGPMDGNAHRLANLLVGNDASQAVLEITLMGPTLRFTEAACIAVTGADLAASIDGEPVALNRPYIVGAGQTLSFSAAKSGIRAYLAVHGGFALEPALGSCSTYLKGKLGGVSGRALKAGDSIGLNTPLHGDVSFLRDVQRQLWDIKIYLSGKLGLRTRSTLRVIKGPHWSLFSDQAANDFGSSPFRITPQSDRMGYRIEGPKLAVKKPVQILSEATAFGAIQVPHGGDPIVIMADRQTMGGYPKIAYICSVDLPSLAQSRPGDNIHFDLISLEHAQELDAKREQAFTVLEAALTDIKTLLAGG